MTPEYHEIAKLKELPNGSAMRVEVDGVEVALVHTEGQVYAIDDVCSHAEVSLSEGEVEGCFIECWLHGSRFDVRTGE
ncbi:MAG: non-heme iron oxygenase ferredoxin subunit, partial [Candidatus Nanopelagicales bacterium]